MRTLNINILTCILVCTGGHILWAQQINNHFVEGKIYVKLKENGSNANVVYVDDQVAPLAEVPSLNQTVLENGGQILSAQRPFFYSKSEDLRRILKLTVDKEEDLLDMIEKLKDDPTIEYAEPVFKRTVIGFGPAAAPNDTSYAHQWYLSRIGAVDAWAVNPGGGIVTVAVVDNAIDTNHVDLKGSLLPGFDVADNDSDPNPPNDTFSHGTHVAGILSAVTNNVTGIASAANNKVMILPIKAAHNTSSNRSIDEGFEGIEKAIEQGVDIISLSWGGEGYSQTEQDVILHAYQEGILVIAAAGNEENDILQYPASYDHVISVAALDSDDGLSSFSSYGTKVDISAPGSGILSTVPSNKYASFSGTSMATPLVASCAGYLLSCFPGLGPDSLEYILKTSSDDVSVQNPNYEGLIGVGCVNLYKAVACRSTGLFSAKPFASPTNLFCLGDTVELAVTNLGTESFEWLSNGTVLGTNPTLEATSEGEYTLRRTDGDCVLSSEPIRLIRNLSFSAPPIGMDTSLAYCQPKNLIVSTIPPECQGYGPKTFSYAGPLVGFDGFDQSGDYPTVEVSGMGGLIDSVSVSVTWEKKDGGNYNSCHVPDGGKKPYNDEISFKVISPEGIEVVLLKEGTYHSGSNSSGVVTTTFTTHGPSIPSGSSPATGSYRAAGDLGRLKNRVSQGTWKLVALDTYLIDPLCVSGFSVIVKSNGPSGPTKIKWYADAAKNSLLGEGQDLSLSGLSVGTHTYFATARCDGFCESQKLSQTKVSIRPVPELLAFSRSTVMLTPAQVNEIRNAPQVDYSIEENIYTVFGQNQYGQAFSYQVSDQAPLLSPISLCVEDDYLVFGNRCPGTIHWSTGETAPAISLMNVSSPMTVTATCQQTWECSPLSDIPFAFTNPSAAVVLGGSIAKHSRQAFYGDGIESAQKIEEGSKIDYTAPSSILLRPGFQVSANAVFESSIGGCP